MSDREPGMSDPETGEVDREPATADERPAAHRRRTALLVGAGAFALLIATVAAVHGLASTGPRVSTAARGTHATSSASPVPHPDDSSAAAPAQAWSAPAPEDHKWVSYLATVPSVPGAHSADPSEVADVFCQALASPTMSPTEYSQLLTLEQHEFALTSAQATQLLTNATAEGCPTYVVVVTSKGAKVAPVTATASSPGDV